MPDSKSGGSEDIPVNENNLTYDSGVYNQMADSIEVAIWGGAFTEDDTSVGDTLLRCMNDDDFNELSRVYGIRGEGVIIQYYYNLLQTIEMYVDNDVRQDVNENYMLNGMETRV